MTLSGFAEKDALVAAAAAHITEALKSALNARGRASLILSGGSSPKPVYETLAQMDLPWDGIGISLVDERWVAPGEAGSNADFIQDCFAGTPAERAHFVPLYNGHASAGEGVKSAEQALASLRQPFDVCVLGMGLDGHTASWFPQSGGLEAALDPTNAAMLCAIDATGCDVAGEHTDRISLTYSAVKKAENVILLLPSAEKLTVFQSALDASHSDKPVAALTGLGDRLRVFAMENGS